MSDFNFKKKFGQNFLQDKNIVQNIVNSINPTENDLVIEIGPGAGALTKLIKAKGCMLLAYEIDADTSVYLDTLIDDKVSIIYDDFMKRNIIDDIKTYKYDNLYVIGNLPYYITTPIVTKIIDELPIVKEAVFMVQKEVADRFAAKEKSREYGSLTVFLNYYFDIQKLFIVNRKCFKPIPNVDSAVVKFIRKDNLLNVDIDKFNKLVKHAFQFKRKNLRNNLRCYNLDVVEIVLKKYNLDLTNRAEDLSLDIFVDIANNI